METCVKVVLNTNKASIQIEPSKDRNKKESEKDNRLGKRHGEVLGRTPLPLLQGKVEK